MWSIKLFLSVNLDNLLEEALWAEGVPHQQYLVGDRPLPAPELIRGYEDIKLANVERFRKQAEALEVHRHSVVVDAGGRC